MSTIFVHSNKNIIYPIMQAESKLTESSKDKRVSFWLLFLRHAGHLVTIPIFIVLHKMFPDPEWSFHADRILLFLLTVITVEAFFQLFRKAIIVGFLVAILYLSIGSIIGKYGFVSLIKDYKYLLFSLSNSPFPEEILVSTLKPFPGKAVILEAIDFEKENVRDFALSATRKHFMGNYENAVQRKWVHCFAVFKEINSNWNYVSDPLSREYYAKASQSVRHLSGDCDDHSILMAACIQSVGGVWRLVYTSNHMYPEMLVGTKKDMESVNYLIKRRFFETESDSMPINYHLDENGKAWLNMDYTAKYPGGPFMKDKILSTLVLR